MRFVKHVNYLYLLGILLLGLVTPAWGHGSPRLELLNVIDSYPQDSRLPLGLLIHPPEGSGLLPPQKAGYSGPPFGLTLHNAPGFSLEDVQIMAPPQEDGLYHDLIPVKAFLRITATAPLGEQEIKASFRFALKDKVLQVFDFAWLLNITPAGQPVIKIYDQATARLLELEEATNPVSQPPQEQSAANDTLAGYSLGIILLLVFLGGLALNLTPCVYPLIPITISYFATQAGGNKRARAVGVLAYWLGMVVMYSGLGLFASLSGGILGQALTHPGIIIALALILLALAASMLGFWELKIPNKFNQIAAVNRRGASGALLMGLTVGVLAAPCLGPFVLGLMTHVATSGNVIYGILLFFVLSLGLGLPLALLAFFSGSIACLPGAGEWMVWVRKFFGVVLVLMAIYVAQSLVSEMVFVAMLALAGMGGGLYLALEKNGNGKGKFMIIKLALSLIMIMASLGFACQHYPTNSPQSSTSKPADQLTWQAHSPQALAAARGKPVLMDFTASWCQPCRQLDAQTFPHPTVQTELSKFVCIKVDMTNGPPNPTAKQFVTQWKIKGVPTLMFLDRQGRVMSNYTLVGFVNAKTMAEHLRQVLYDANR